MTCFMRAGFFLALLTAGFASAAETVWLDELDLEFVRQGWKTPQVNTSVTGWPLRLGGKTFKRGVGSHAPGVIHVELDGKARRFRAVVGIDDVTKGRGTVTIGIAGDGKRLFKSELLRGDGPPCEIDLDLSGIHRLVLVMGDAGDDSRYDHVDWADAKFTVKGAAPRIVPPPAEEKVILTPPPPKEPRINGPRIIGVRPGSPFLFRIPATGNRPMRFSASNLPEGLAVDPDTGIVTGRIIDPTHRAYHATLVAENTHGASERELRIAVGDKLALAPPMGWNHWYVHYNLITDAIMREAADLMVLSGMADVGYQYVNIDDCWMNAAKHADAGRVGPLRDDHGDIVPNSYFPDMQALTDYIHAKGLKAGLYTSPGPLTCAGFAGSWEHEEQDARKFAEWGFDFLKYDWCSYTEIAVDKSLPEFKKPYIKMGAILKQLDRDIVLNLCQYGMGDVWTWGEEVGGHCWRTAGDLGFELTRYHDVATRNSGFRDHARPGAWNDPDYLLLGYVGEARGMKEPKPCPLTPNGQYSYMSLWCLMASPLFFSGDMARLDEFTLNVLCNPEVIDINQDPLGNQGYCVATHDDTEVWKKELEDGSIAVGLFNRNDWEQEVAARWKDLGITGKRAVRDLWRHKDLGQFDSEFTATIGRHGVLLVRLGVPGR